MAGPHAPVYSKSNPAGGAPMPRRQKRLLIAACAVIAAAVAGGGLWAGLSSDPLATSANGCISVDLPGSIGGQLLHECGSQARSTCHDAYASSDSVSLAERPACQQAGLTRAKVG
jgi:hypothetical protein